MAFELVISIERTRVQSPASQQVNECGSTNYEANSIPGTLDLNGKTVGNEVKTIEIDVSSYKIRPFK